MIHFRVRYERLRLRISRTRRRVILLRALWIALLVPLGATALRVAAAADPDRLLLLAVTLLVFLAAAAWGARSAAESEPSRLLDQRYGLGELIVTAVEVDGRGPSTAIEERLLDDAASAVTVIGSERSVGGSAVRREGETVLGLLLVIGGLWILSGAAAAEHTTDRLPTVSWSAIGGLDSEPGGGVGPGAGPGEGRGAGSGTSPALDSLASALGDHAAALTIARALEDGDPAAAARMARALADRAPELTDSGRHDLADALHEAAANVEEQEPDLADALRRAGRALESPDPVAAAPGVEQLASELDMMAARGGTLGAEAGAPEALSREGPPAARLAVEPEENTLGPAEHGDVSSSGRTDRGADPDAAEAGTERATGGSSPEGRVEASHDPLRYPWRLRETVRRYFTRGEPLR